MSGDPVATASGSDLVGFADFLCKATTDLGQRSLASGTARLRKYPGLGNLVIMFGPYIHQLMSLEVKPEQATASDVELLHAVARGDEAALARLYDQYRVILFGLLVRILGSREEAEDVLQDVFIQVWRRARDFDEKRGKPFTWLVTLARSRAIDRLRQLGARQRLARAAANDEADTVSDALSDTIQSGQREIVQRALAELPEEQREALVLAYYDGLTQSEIASKLGTPLGTVKTRMRSGMAKLRELLSTQLENFSYTGKA